ncbi:2,3,4,5-tetrahydropyridine-2,6-dicarboxylate N-acetyltransferase [Marinitoga piezophila KA3]|uniref:2,3,4,5-tetrahydropyridine-2,6-dicarboxylate N-acetyltransferase n=1 Tax=Marinitoga piezophila (strain DSM 14283 / JCM 11233 / KA3) TaxID=443254 RepID=H2J5N6_MARPK|nr:2,3,4,5-tetrahydropyridine-2,6-dicarboxylate N-acetyltransferase [Marinitoga piezophila]AEX85022.1 2,3,4,5-tetrahydropyridine-2,6-dicarboxylate N-acetyltransferase [Marinitoga piezophila KA3]
MNSYEIIEYIAKSKKTTPVKVYLKGDLKDLPFNDYFGDEKSGVLFCELEEFESFLSENREKIENYKIELDRRNSAIPLLDLKKINARIEPGAIIRDLVEIGDNVVIMMGAVINIGAKIGSKTMIDMNAVIGGRAIIGNNCHIGAGAVIAGVIEPPSADPVIIADNVLIGANAVILEGIKIGENSVVAAGAIVTSDIEPNSVVAGVPAKIIKKVDEKTKSKTQILDALREL